jgi:hypothetical protein
MEELRSGRPQTEPTPPRPSTIHRPPSTIFGLALAAALLAAWPARADDLDQAVRQAKIDYVKSLSALAGWCDEHGLKEQAQQTRAWFAPRDPNKLYLPVLSKTPLAAAPPAGASPEIVEWNNRFTQLKRDQANALYELARKATHAQRASLAYELALLALVENPDHDALRRVMGYQKYKGQWCTFYEGRKLREGKVWHPKFGWLPQSHVARYEQGQRYSGGKWISAEDDARLHNRSESGWDVETEHYTIRTNHSVEAGAQLGVKLEELYHLWQQVFIHYYATPAQVLAQFEGRARIGATTSTRFHVVYFRDRDDYNHALEGRFPNITMTTGVYIQRLARACFFAGKDQDDRTIYHEATHQLFLESRPVPIDVVGRSNFWVVEGVAMFMESLRKEGGFFVLGGFDDVRMKAAQYRLLNDGFYVPLSEFCGYNSERLQSDPHVARLYSQAAGLTNFLMFDHDGRYREALVHYLVRIYSGGDDLATLAQLTGANYAQLDHEYREFMQSVSPSVSGEKPNRQ